jgi:hypothetical protein
MTHPLFQENTPASQSLVICPFCHSSDTEFFFALWVATADGAVLLPRLPHAF